MRLVWLVVFLAVFSPWADACEPATGTQARTAVGTPQAPLNLNDADVAELQRLSGIGAVKAQAIVDHRQTHGAFASVDELLEVKGIGKALLQRNRAQLTVD
ncbi:MAG: ComEA family DNA-binding protein [Pseudomonas oryzihabitans]